MKLPRKFIQLPFKFDAERLRQEALQFEPHEWREHPQKTERNWALLLISAQGHPDDDSIKGPMRPTPLLERCPYLKQILCQMNTVWGRTRFMKLEIGAEATPHVDINYYWMRHMRMHIPLVTFPDVRFVCGDEERHMAAGECWIFDTWENHNAINSHQGERIHLVADTVGSPEFWRMIHRAIERPSAPQFVPYAENAATPLVCESENFSVVMHPGELENMLGFLLREAASGDASDMALARVEREMLWLTRAWGSLWATFGTRQEGFGRYRKTLEEAEQRFEKLHGTVFMPNRQDICRHIIRSILVAMLNPELTDAAVSRTPIAADTGAEIPLQPEPVPAAVIPAASGTIQKTLPDFDRPVFIVAAPRSGSTLLFELMSQSPDLYTIGREAHREFESIAALRPENRGYESNRLTALDARPDVRQELLENLASTLRNRGGAELPEDNPAFRFLEKTPKNALRIPFLKAIFPNARFIYLTRESRSNIASQIDAWNSGKFITYPHLPGWTDQPWSLLLIPGWRELVGKPIEEIAARQWATTHRIIMDDLAALPAEEWTTVRYEDLLSRPQEVLQRLCKFAGIGWDCQLAPDDLPLSKHTLTPPDPDKWRRHESAIESVWPIVADIAKRIAALHDGRNAPTEEKQETMAEKTESRPAVETQAGTQEAPKPDINSDEFLASVHTTNLPDLFSQLGSTLLISTYQAGKLVMVRVDDGKLNTHFRSFNKPMGMTGDRGVLYLGTHSEIREFRNMSDVSRRMEPPGRHDAVFLPRNIHISANIDIHEMALDGDGELWFVNTLFSCLCTLDPEYSFTPRWRPKFVTHLAPEDRCHLNGLAMYDGRPKYVTALGQSNAPRGWRENKKDGGILIDFDTHEIVADKLSMPHSPRWYRGKLWILESGKGSLATVDISSGKVETIARLPGFTRGLDFMGPLAFVGLSQLRETNAFTDIPVTDENPERQSGVWIIHIETGQTVGFLRFTAGVQEIFAVQMLQGMRFPEILEFGDKLLHSSYALPDAALKEVGYTQPDPALTK